jgi:sRNA-binding protein
LFAQQEQHQGKNSMEPTKQENFRREMFAAHDAILSNLVELCPETFAPRGRSCWPLKVGIHEDIAAELPDASPRDISLFLLCYTRQRRYHRALKEGASRLDLSGQPDGAVSATEAEHAMPCCRCGQKALSPQGDGANAKDSLNLYFASQQTLDGGFP